MHQPLLKSYKNRFPFILSVPSFIYKDGYVANVKMIGPCVDEIELLLFESALSCTPSHGVIKQLKDMGDKFTLTYNIHMPVDIYLGHYKEKIRKYAMDTVLNFIDLTESLKPSTRTLHLNMNQNCMDKKEILKWKKCLRKSFEFFEKSGVSCSDFTIENLNYPCELLDELLSDFKLGVCLDIGHLIMEQVDISLMYEKYRDRIKIIHLHGSDGIVDHTSLKNLSGKNSEKIVEILKDFTKPVSVEVFSRNDLQDSLEFLEKLLYS